MFSDLISLADLETEDVTRILNLADDLKAKQRAGVQHRLLDGQTLVMIFEKPSLRTRLTFETGIFQLGGQAIFIEDKLGRRESIPDVARNLERWVDGIVARTHSHEAVVELARYASIPVINALTDKLHPCQVLADAQTLREKRGTLSGQKVAFIGDGNNMFASWANLSTHFPIHLHLACPDGFDAEEDISAYAQAHTKGSFRVTRNPAEAVKGADVVYTDVWTSMGQEEERDHRHKAFAGYQVNALLMAHAKPDALFMHCLPAHRGEEVADEVIEGKQSVVFDQAENRLHAQKAVMVLLMQK